MQSTLRLTAILAALAGCAAPADDGFPAGAHPCQPIFDRLAQDPAYLAYPADIRAEIGADLCAEALGGY